MTHRPARSDCPNSWIYKGFLELRAHGRFYGIPGHMELEEVIARGWLSSHPAILSAPTRDKLDVLIDALDGRPAGPEPVGSYQGYSLVRHRGAIYGLPQSAGSVDLDVEEDRRRAGAVCGKTREEVEERIRGLRETVPVEFAGWLPIYERSANCGQHPQFKHIADPPPGYRFTYSAPRKNFRESFWDKVGRRLLQGMTALAWGLWLLTRPLLTIFRGSSAGSFRARLRVLGAMTCLFFKLLWKGARLVPVLRFLRTRHYRSQVLLGRRGLVFLTSMPYTYGQNPWIVEIEDPTTLFYPFVENGDTAELEITASPYFPIVKALLESDQCKGILTHMKSTARMLPALFGSERIAAKVRYSPLGVELPRRWQRHHDGDTDPIDLVFVNSWHQMPASFFVRGGLDVLEAFAVLRERYPQLRLTLRTELPDLDPHYHQIIESGWVRVIRRTLSAEEMDALLAESHIFLLPSARVHIVSLLQAMSYGLAVVTSDGWGIEEYIDDERNGLIVKGRYGTTSWGDEEAGLLREKYEPMATTSSEVVRGLVEAVSRLVEDRSLRRRLGRAARRDVETTFTLERWNRGLKEALDLARAPTGQVPQFDASNIPWIGTPHVSASNLLADCANEATHPAAPAAPGEPDGHRRPSRSR
jgi:glycosyltransferase involved in cell wall biosynthesis